MADLTMLVHFTFLAFVVFGGFLAWKWPRVIWAHLLLAAYGFATIAFSIRCPLTDVEDWARVRIALALAAARSTAKPRNDRRIVVEKTTPETIKVLFA